MVGFSSGAGMTAIITAPLENTENICNATISPVQTKRLTRQCKNQWRYEFCGGHYVPQSRGFWSLKVTLRVFFEKWWGDWIDMKCTCFCMSLLPLSKSRNGCKSLQRWLLLPSMPVHTEMLFQTRVTGHTRNAWIARRSPVLYEVCNSTNLKNCRSTLKLDQATVNK